MAYKKRDFFWILDYLNRASLLGELKNFVPYWPVCIFLFITSTHKKREILVLLWILLDLNRASLLGVSEITSKSDPSMLSFRVVD